jgi:hypothetical protein
VFSRNPLFPILRPGERAVAEASLGADIAVLTERRLIIVGRASEASVPLAHIARIAVRFERSVGAMVGGVLLIAAALFLFAITGPVRAFFLNQSVALEPTVRQELATGVDEDAGLAHGIQRITGRLATAARAIPVLAWLALAFGLMRIALGILGRTVISVGAGGSEFELMRRGRNALLEDFVKEVGRNLPVAAA